MKTFIISVYHKWIQFTGKVRSRIHLINQFCKENGVYPRLTVFVTEILIQGTLIWLSVLPFAGTQWLYRVWAIPMLGVIPWLILHWAKEAIRLVKYT
jgi:hypothetical protein